MVFAVGRSVLKVALESTVESIVGLPNVPLLLVKMGAALAGAFAARTRREVSAIFRGLWCCDRGAYVGKASP